MLRLTTLFFLISYLSFAQVDEQSDKIETIAKGTTFIGGGFSFNFDNNSHSNNSTKYKTSGFGISPVAGKYFRDNLSIGLGLNYGYSQVKYDYDGGAESKSKSHGAGLFSFIRKNNKILPNFFFFLQAQTNFNYGVFENTNSFSEGNEGNSLSLGLGATVGLQLFVTPKISLESNFGSAGYRYRRVNYDQTDYYTEAHGLYAGGGFESLYFSIRYFIHR
jgi:hypothetical protein